MDNLWLQDDLYLQMSLLQLCNSTLELIYYLYPKNQHLKMFVKIMFDFIILQLFCLKLILYFFVGIFWFHYFFISFKITFPEQLKMFYHSNYFYHSNLLSIKEKLINFFYFHFFYNHLFYHQNLDILVFIIKNF